MDTGKISKLASTRILTRILTILEIQDMNISEISHEVHNLQRAKDGVLWLINHGFVEKYCGNGKRNTTTMYRLKKREMKGGKNDRRRI